MEYFITWFPISLVWSSFTLDLHGKISKHVSSRPIKFQAQTRHSIIKKNITKQIRGNFI